MKHLYPLEKNNLSKEKIDYLSEFDEFRITENQNFSLIKNRYHYINNFFGSDLYGNSSKIENFIRDNVYNIIELMPSKKIFYFFDGDYLHFDFSRFDPSSKNIQTIDVHFIYKEEIYLHELVFLEDKIDNDFMYCSDNDGDTYAYDILRKREHKTYEELMEKNLNKGEYISLDDSKEHREFFRHKKEGMLLGIINILSFVCYAEENNFYPMFKRNLTTDNDKKNKIKGKHSKRKDGRSVVYLNKHEVENIFKDKSKKVCHASPIPHYRRGHWRRLMDKRYINNVNYGKRIWVKESMIRGFSDIEKIISNVIYKVIIKDDNNIYT